MIGKHRLRRDAAICNAIREGESVSSIADRLFITTNTVRKIARCGDVQLTLAKRGRKPDLEREAIILAHLQGGKTVAETSQIVGSAKPKIRQIATRNGINPKRSESLLLKKERNASICALLLTGESMTEIARAEGVSRERVRQIAMKADITDQIIANRPVPNIKLKYDAAQKRRAEKKQAREDRVAHILELQSQGLNQGQIGAILGTSQVNISRILCRNGHRSIHRPIRIFPTKPARKARRKSFAPLYVKLPKAQHTEHDPSLISSARTLWDEGLSTSRIAERLTTKERPLSKNAIVGIAHRHGFTPRPSPLRKREADQPAA